MISLTLIPKFVYNNNNFSWYVSSLPVFSFEVRFSLDCILNINYFVLIKGVN